MSLLFQIQPLRGSRSGAYATASIPDTNPEGAIVVSTLADEDTQEVVVPMTEIANDAESVNFEVQ